MTLRFIYSLFVAMTLISCSDDINANEPSTPGTASVSGTLPVLHIETENRQPITSKTEYLDARYWLETSGDSNVDPIGNEAEPLPMQIRGRGHSSWKSPKKPYKIKLAKKTAIMGAAA